MMIVGTNNPKSSSKAVVLFVGVVGRFLQLLLLLLFLVLTVSTTATANNNNNNNGRQDDDVDIIVTKKYQDYNYLQLRTIPMPGIVLYKTPTPLKECPVEDGFPGHLPVQFIQEAWDINVTQTEGAKRLMSMQQQKQKQKECMQQQQQHNDNNDANNDNNEQQCINNDATDNIDIHIDLLFGASLLARATEMFVERNLLDELQEFLSSGVSNPDAGPRRMHWVGITIQPNMSLALHSHPNIEMAYIVEGVMHEYRLVDESIEKKKVYVPEKRRIIMENGKERQEFKYIGPDLSSIHADETLFEKRSYHEGDMFINSIGDVHQSFTGKEGVKLFVIWGDGNADIPDTHLPQNAEFLNKQSAKAWT